MENYKVAWKHFEEICTLVIKLFEIAKEDKKVVVIVSDALRYEAANKLLSEMHGDAKIQQKLAIGYSTSLSATTTLHQKHQANVW